MIKIMDRFWRDLAFVRGRFRFVLAAPAGMVLCSALFAAPARGQEAPKAAATAAEEGAPAGELTYEEIMELRIDLDYKEAEIANILRSLAWTYDLNIVTSPDVKGKATINLRNTRVRDALDAILKINGLTYVERNGIIFISTGGQEGVEVRSEVFFLKYISAAEAKSLLARIVSARGSVEVNQISDSIIVTDFPESIEKIRELLDTVDIPPKQVLIEAKILDITATNLGSMGVRWDFDYNPDGGLFGRGTQTAEQLKGTIAMGAASSQLTGGQLALNTLTLKNWNVTALVDALLKEGKANLLASPSIAVLNGQEARIVIGERFPFKERTQTATGTTETTKFVDIGTTLRVIPRINEDGYITMYLHPEVSSLAAALDAGPRVTTREADTTVRVKEGETLIIGGLISQKEERNVEKVPVLGDIPILGALFRRQDKNIEQKELAVFVTPRALRSSQEQKLYTARKNQEDEVRVIIDKTSRLMIVEQIYQYAENLMNNIGAVGANKEEYFRRAQALSLYSHIILEYPTSERVPDCHYNAARIYYQDGHYARAQESLARLISDFPESPLVPEAKKFFELVEHAAKNK